MTSFIVGKVEKFFNSIEIVQDLVFPASCQRLKLTPDRNLLIASGLHAPSIRCFELSHFALKFERFLEAEVIDFQILSDDFSKMVHLCRDRSIVLQSRCSTHFKTRFPCQGRDLAYLPSSADIVVVGSSPEVFRLNLAEGKMLKPLPTCSPAVNSCGLSKYQGLLACAGEDGVLECFDFRVRNSVGLVNVTASAGLPGSQLTTVRFDDNGFTLAVGTSSGQVLLYDIRSSRPMLKKDHILGSPIIDIKFQKRNINHINEQIIITSDAQTVKLWDKNDGKPYTSIQNNQENGNINDVCLWNGSGLIMLAVESPRILPYFIPSLGPVPKWCSFLENILNEIEDKTQSKLFDDFKFITHTEVTNLGLTHLLGSSLLKSYMHGFFIDNRLYRKAKATTEPYAFENLRHQNIEAENNACKQTEKISSSCVEVVQCLPKVNATIAAKLLEKQKIGCKHAHIAAAVLEDERFKNMFTDPMFCVDETSKEFENLDSNSKQDKTFLNECFIELRNQKISL
jgi:ribosome biogenesis protein ENP2